MAIFSVKLEDAQKCIKLHIILLNDDDDQSSKYIREREKAIKKT